MGAAIDHKSRDRTAFLIYLLWCNLCGCLLTSTIPLWAVNIFNLMFQSPRWNSIKGNTALFWKPGAARWKWMSLARGTENVVFHRFLWYCDVWIKFWPLQIFKTSQVLSSMIFIPEKVKSECRNPKWLDQKFRNKVFRTSYQNSCTMKCLVSAVQFVPEEPYLNPENVVCEMDELDS